MRQQLIRPHVSLCVTDNALPRHCWHPAHTSEALMASMPVTHSTFWRPWLCPGAFPAYSSGGQGCGITTTSLPASE